MNGFDRLRHDAVIGGHNEHDDIGDLRAACAHGAERGVARRIEKGDALAIRQAHLIGADVLGDAAMFARDNVGLTECIKQ